MSALTGHCLCGGVAFEVDRRDLGEPSACHCTQCRRFAGDVWTAVNVPRDGFRFTAGETLVAWYESSDFARRGFCTKCGSSLFYHAHGLDDYKDRIAIAVGALDAPTGLKTAMHIFVADKGDYYDIADGLPQKAKL
ncbi:MAG: GFA family protein [Pseudomonadota bacterium]